MDLFFKQICIDGNEGKLPSWLTHTPALILINVPMPIYGENTFKWLESIKNGKQIKYQVAEQGPNAFISEEMGGLSDSFAYTNFDFAQPKSFSSTSEASDYIFTPPEKKKIEEKEQKNLLNTYSKSRKEQDNQFLNKIKEHHEKLISDLKKPIYDD